MHMEREKELIAICRSKVEQQLNWGDSSSWTNSDFELLSDKIFEKTQVRLSISTLKRIWGKVKYENSPTAVTLNALANFLNYPSWRDFEAAEGKVVYQSSEVPASPVSASKPSGRKPFVRILTMAAVVIACMLVVVLLVKGRTPHVLNASLAKFKSHEVTDDLPNSVIFDYDVSALRPDSVFIQQNWDPRRREKVSPQGKQHTSVYYAPGYFEAKLIVNDSIVKEDIVFIKTTGWKAIVDNKPIPIYLSDENIRSGNKLIITSEILREKLGTPVFNEKVVTLHNIRDYGVEGSSFDFEATLRNASLPEESVCRRVYTTILTTNGIIVIPLSTRGCISELGYMTGEGSRSGKENDLSAFGCDFRQLEKLQISTHRDTLKVHLNDKTILTERQGSPLGTIVGIRFAFEGAGEVGYVKLNGSLIE